MSALLSQPVVQWFVTKYGVTEEAAVGALSMFAKGEGQFPAELTEFSPDAYAEYKAAFDAAVAAPVVEEAPVVAEETPAVVEEPAPVVEEVVSPSVEA